MIHFTLHHTETRFIHDAWLNYMVQLANTRVINHAGNDANYLRAMEISSLIDAVAEIFKKKLENTAVMNHKFTLDYHYAGCFYFHIFTQPIPTVYSFEKTLKDRLVKELQPQLFAMRPPVHENIEITIEDYYADYIS